MDLLRNSKKRCRVASSSIYHANSEFNTRVEVSEQEENRDEESPIENTIHDDTSTEVLEGRFSQEEEKTEEVPTLLEPLPDDAAEEQITRSKINTARVNKWEIELLKAQRRFQPYSQIVHEAYKQKKKKTRGMAKVDTCIPKSGRGILHWNVDGVPIGRWAPKFTRFIGWLSKRSELWNIARDWVDQPYSSFRDTWRDIQRHYKVEDLNAWNFTFEILASKILDYRTRLKLKYYETYDNDKDRFLNLPNVIEPLQFAMLMNKWESEKFQEKSKISQKNRGLKKMNHHLGGRSIACTAEEMKKELKRKPRKLELAKRVYTASDPNRKTSDKNKETLDKIEKAVSIATLENEQSKTNKPMEEIEEESILQVLGRARTDRIRFAGVGASRLNRSTQGRFSSQQVHEMVHTVENKYKRKLANVSKRTKKMEVENRMIKEALLKLNPNLQNLFKVSTHANSSRNNEDIDGAESDGIDSSSYNDDDNDYDVDDDIQDDDLGST